MTTEERTTTAVRLPKDLHERLLKAAEERGWSMNATVIRATEDYLGRLVPVSELHYTRD